MSDGNKIGRRQACAAMFGVGGGAMLAGAAPAAETCGKGAAKKSCPKFANDLGNLQVHFGLHRIQAVDEGHRGHSKAETSSSTDTTGCRIGNVREEQCDSKEEASTGHHEVY